jgi:uncharacterized protein
MENKVAGRVKKNVRSLMHHMSGSNPDIILAIYLFGSTATGKNTLASDVDIAFLISPEAYRADPVLAIQPPYLIATQLGMQMKRQTDVTILNSASLEMAYEIMTTGECVYEKDLGQRLEYEIALKGMFYDFKPFLDELRDRCVAEL